MGLVRLLKSVIAVVCAAPRKLPRPLVGGAAIVVLVVSLAVLQHGAGHDGTTASLLRRNQAALDQPSYIEDKYTIMISTFNRDEALKLTLKEIASGDLENLHSVVIVWHDPNRDPPRDIVDSLPTFAVPVTIRRSTTDSLNNRFKLGPDIKTRAVMSRDDDLFFGPGDVEFQFKQWIAYGRHERMVGTAAREVILNPDGATKYKYRMTDMEKYEVMLTNAAFMDVSFLELYWSDDPRAKAVRDYVDKDTNCEDIAMNYFVANKTGLPPLLVEGKEPRRYYRSSGISSSPSHFQTRSMCCDVFQQLFGGLELPYNTEVIKRSGSEIRDFWDSIPPPPNEGREDHPSANEQKHMKQIAEIMHDASLTQRQKDDLVRKRSRQEEKHSAQLVKLREQMDKVREENRWLKAELIKLQELGPEELE
ncbi:hypothetical protein ACM66B_003304 [Microbotryomycetes sp. NB124-2]